MRSVKFDDLERAALRVYMAEPETYRTSWCRRWLWKIDRTVDAARKFQNTNHPAGLLAGAAVSLYEAQECEEGEVGDWQHDLKRNEAERLIAAALAMLP